MERQDLVEYVKMCVDMEKDIYTQEKLRNHFEEECRTLNEKKVLEEPIKFLNDSEAYMWNTASFITFVFLIFLVLRRITSDTNGGLLFILLLVAAVFCLIFFVALAIDSDKQFEKQKQDYSQRLSVYNEEIKIEKQRLEEAEKKKILLKNCINKIDSQLVISKSILEKVYSAGVIYPPYRNFAMLCSIYDYFCANKCKTLGEAYNLLDSEIRFERLIIKLDMVIEKLDEIKGGQYMLYSAMQQSNMIMQSVLDSTNKMAGELENIKDNEISILEEVEKMQKDSYLTKCNTEQIQKHIYYQNRMNYLNGKYNGILGNSLPY